MILGTLAAFKLENAVTRKGVVRARVRVVRAGQHF